MDIIESAGNPSWVILFLKKDLINFKLEKHLSPINIIKKHFLFLMCGVSTKYLYYIDFQDYLQYLGNIERGFCNLVYVL